MIFYCYFIVFPLLFYCFPVVFSLLFRCYFRMCITLLTRVFLSETSGLSGLKVNAWEEIASQSNDVNNPPVLNNMTNFLLWNNGNSP
jgi:hypothetical protein